MQSRQGDLCLAVGLQLEFLRVQGIKKGNFLFPANLEFFEMVVSDTGRYRHPLVHTNFRAVFGNAPALIQYLRVFKVNGQLLALFFNSNSGGVHTRVLNRNGFLGTPLKNEVYF